MPTDLENSRRVPSWREVAEALAERLESHAKLAGASAGWLSIENSGCTHSLADADPDNCPFCADRVAYRLYQRKLRGTGG